jgi:hypothetical protein
VCGYEITEPRQRRSVIAFEAIPAGVGVLRRAVRTHIIAWGVPASSSRPSWW